MTSSVTNKQGMEKESNRIKWNGRLARLSPGQFQENGRDARSTTAQRRREYGFTLIELLAVIVIMALIAAIGFPAMKAMQGTALSAASRQFSTALILARQYAINMRTPVRVILPTTYTGIGGANSNLVCRSFGIFWSSNDLNGATIAWWPLQDWRTLPTGVVFSDHTTRQYAVVNGTPYPSLGSTPRQTANGPSVNQAWGYFDNWEGLMPLITNITVASSVTSSRVSYVEFRPTGEARCSATPPQGAAGVRLGLGTVTTPPVNANSPRLLINNSNNWAYVEYDTRNGRVRVRTPESYQ